MSLDERARRAARAVQVAVEGVGPNPLPSFRTIAVKRAVLALALVAVVSYFSIQVFDNLGNRRVETADRPPDKKGVELDQTPPAPGGVAPGQPAPASTASPKAGARTGGERQAPAGAGNQGAISQDQEIAFNQGDDIYLMNADASNLRKLRAGGEPAWSRDGKLIAFAGPRLRGEIQLLNPDGSGFQNLRVKGSSPTWSPDGGQLAFNWECDAQFGGPCDLPDGSQKDCGPECGIGVVGRDGTGIGRLGNGIWPDWGPDGRIVFMDGMPSGPCLYRPGFRIGENAVRCALPIWVMNRDGSGRTRLPIDKAISPTWSADGRRIAYYTDTDGVFVANSDGTGIVKVAPAGDWEPAWSPDGLWLALVRYGSDNTHSIYLKKIDGSGERPLTSGGNDNFPAFSPRG